MRTTTRYVAVCDILGFKDIVSRSDPAELANRVSKLLSWQGSTGVWASSNGEKSFSGRTASYQVHFSDTVLIYSRARDDLRPEAWDFQVSHFFHSVQRLLLSGFLAGLPIRAGIAYGEVSVDSKTRSYVGPAIVAAHLAESSQEWSGCALSPSCTDPHISMWTTPYTVPLKSGVSSSIVDGTRCLDWTYHVAWSRLRPHVPELKGLYPAFRRGFRHFVHNSSPGAESKIINTREYILRRLITSTAELRIGLSL